MNSQKKYKKFNNCDMISSSIGEIVRFSTNEKFRKSCYQAMKVDSTQALEDKINSKFRQLCAITDLTDVPKITINPNKAENLGNSDDEESANWALLAASQRKKTLKRRASAPNLSNQDKENTPVKFWSQPFERFTTFGKIAKLQFTPETNKYVHKSPSQNFIENAMKGAPIRDRTLDVPDKTRKILFTEEIPIINLFE